MDQLRAKVKTQRAKTHLKIISVQPTFNQPLQSTFSQPFLHPISPHKYFKNNLPSIDDEQHYRATHSQITFIKKTNLMLRVENPSVIKQYLASSLSSKRPSISNKLKFPERNDIVYKMNTICNIPNISEWKQEWELHHKDRYTHQFKFLDIKPSLPRLRNLRPGFSTYSPFNFTMEKATIKN